MKTTIYVTFLGVALLAVGCVSTVSGTKTAGVPFVQDTIRSRYERPMDEVYDAAKAVIQFNGTLVDEKILYGQTNMVNNMVKTLAGKVDQDSVWVRVGQVDPKITAVEVQARTANGGGDIALAAELDKQIALKLVR